MPEFKARSAPTPSAKPRSAPLGDRRRRPQATALWRLVVADGELIVFTDDDVEPVPAWLVAYEEAADRCPQVGVFGGPIVPSPIEPPSDWFDVSCAHHAELFARTEFDDERVEPEHQLFGPNFMLRRSVLDLLDEIPMSSARRSKPGAARAFPWGRTPR
jgi:hypothetical protein